MDDLKRFLLNSKWNAGRGSMKQLVLAILKRFEYFVPTYLLLLKLKNINQCHLLACTQTIRAPNLILQLRYFRFLLRFQLFQLTRSIFSSGTLPFGGPFDDPHDICTWSTQFREACRHRAK